VDGGSTQTLELRLLGPFEAIGPRGTVTLGGPKQRALLAVLALQPGRVVSIDRLIEDLWSEDPPPTAEHVLQVYVSNLRKALRAAGVEGAVLERASPGYRLNAAFVIRDLDGFEQALAEGTAALGRGEAGAAAEILRDASAMWRGDPLGDLPLMGPAVADVAALDELRLTAIERRNEADLAVGRHAEITPALQALVARHPLRERFREHLMLALYRSGRQADALEVVRDGRRILADELGIDPSAGLRDLERAILRQEPSLDVSEPTSVTLEAAEDPTAPSGESPVLEDVRKLVTVVRLEMVPKEAGRLDAERFQRVVSTGYERLRAVFAAHGGAVTRADPGAFVAIFGVPRAHEDDALRAILASLDAVAASTMDGSPAVRIGIATGEVLAHDPASGEVDVGGDVVEMAAAHQRAAAVGSIVIDELTHRLTRDPIAVTEPGGADATGVVVVGRTDRADRSRMRAPMIGRDRESGLLLAAFERSARERRAVLCTVAGTPGIGKTRLLEEFVRAVANDALVLQSRCLAYGDGITFWPAAEAVRQAAGITPGDPARHALEKLASLFGPDDDAVGSIARMIGLSEQEPTQGEELPAMRRLVAIVGADRPLVWVVEDLHWAEPKMLDLLEHLATRSRDVPVMIVCTARPELLETRPHWGGGATDALSVSLLPLTDADATRLIDSLLGRAHAPDALRARVTEAAGGNPLFVEQLLSMLVDDGTLHRGKDGWVLSGDLDPLAVPESIQALLAARLDRLPHEERSVLGAAAVVGKEFDRAGVEALVPEADVAANLEALAWRELVRTRDRDGEHWQFAHVLVLSAAYASIPKARRRDLHERYAIWLEATSGSRAAEVQEILGYHLEQAARYAEELGAAEPALAERAASPLSAAGLRAFARGDMSGAVNLLSRATALLRPDDPARARILPELGTAFAEIGDLEHAADVLTEGVARSEAAGEGAAQARALFYLRELQMWRGDFQDETSSQVLDLIPVLEGRDDHAGLAFAWRTVSLDSRGAEPSQKAAERALGHARRADDLRTQRELLQNIVDYEVTGPAPAPTGIETCNEYLTSIARGDRVAEAAVMIIARCRLLAMQGRFDEAWGDVATARSTFEELGLELWLAAQGSMAPTDVAMMQGDLARCEAFARESIDRFRRIGSEGFWLTISQLRLARALYEQARFEEAARILEDAGDTSGYAGFMGSWGIRALLLAQEGEFEEAERAARSEDDSIDVWYLWAKAEVSFARSRVLHLAGRATEAIEVGREAVALFERKGDVAEAATARTFLDALTGGAR
jgi:DNA-binding SARP family transcriptional activator/tetratricopeptide (TPR) repeat protein